MAGRREEVTKQPPPPRFFVNVASKEISIPVSPLDATQGLLQVLILKELGESQGACAKCLPEKAWKTSGELVAGCGQGTDKGMKKKRIQRESEPLARFPYYILYIILLRANVNTVVSARSRSGGSAALKSVWNPGSRDVQTSVSRDSAAGEQVAVAEDLNSAGLHSASALFANSPPLRP